MPHRKMNRFTYILAVVLFYWIPLASSGQQILLTNEATIVLSAVKYEVKRPYGKRRISIAEKEEILFEYDSVQQVFTSRNYTKEKLIEKYTLNESLGIRENNKSPKKEVTFPSTLPRELLLAFQADLCTNSIGNQEPSIINPSYCNLSGNNYGIDFKWLKNNITLFELMRRAKKQEVLWHFSPSYLMFNQYKELRKLFRSYINIDSFNVFLTGFVKPIPFNVTHHLAKIDVKIIQGGDTIISMSKNLSITNQPSSWLNNANGSILYNPEVEILLNRILPNGFLLREESINHYILNSYLNWIIERLVLQA